ncbi:glutathione peroxidase [Brachybacterium paraconglomeratum]|uniref:glutathione peroxidase n=1 Tax=Brachybacterium paraconglomeratum TaxID=173362 RepID=UPI0031ED84C3
MTTLADFTATTISGQDQQLADHLGSVVLVVNTASKCGLTPQYAGLQALHERFGEQGLTVLGFPCDQFMNQEPGTEEEISEFCQVNYGVSFPMFAKVDVNGEGAHPLYTWLTGAHEDAADSDIEASDAAGDGITAAAIDAGDIEWNFAKFLLGRDGTVLRRYAPAVEPADIADDIEAALSAQA